MLFDKKPQNNSPWNAPVKDAASQSGNDWPGGSPWFARPHAEESNDMGKVEVHSDKRDDDTSAQPYKPDNTPPSGGNSSGNSDMTNHDTTHVAKNSSDDWPGARAGEKSQDRTRRSDDAIVLAVSNRLRGRGERIARVVSLLTMAILFAYIALRVYAFDAAAHS